LDSVMKPSARNRPSSDRTYRGTVVIPYVKGIAGKFRRIIFKTKHTLRGTLMKPGPVRDAQKTKQCDKGLLENSKLAQHAYGEDHKICCKEAKVLQIEHNTTYRKYKESADMSLLHHPISQPSVDIAPIWTPVITAEVNRLQRRQV
ncbi:hypothetical protein B7P43_G01557, partial [Cryptotermes secundus]